MISCDTVRKAAVFVLGQAQCPDTTSRIWTRMGLLAANRPAPPLITGVLRQKLIEA